ncbi:MAG: 50S ribosomal protein L20 [bacterium]
MSRVKRGMATKKRHKRLLKKTKGYWGQRSNVFRRATETMLRALAFAFVGRKNKKREYRKLFVQRINAACRQHDLSYSTFIGSLNKLSVKINRKMLSQLSIFEPEAFTKLVELAKK